MRALVFAAVLLGSMGAAHADDKSPGTALGISAGTTAAGVGLFFGGLSSHTPAATITGLGLVAIGPSAGHIYSGRYDKTMMAVRLVGLAAASAALIDATRTHPNDTADVVAFIGGGAMATIGGLAEILSAYDVSVTPTPRGIAIAGRF